MQLDISMIPKRSSCFTREHFEYDRDTIWLREDHMQHKNHIQNSGSLEQRGFALCKHNRTDAQHVSHLCFNSKNTRFIIFIIKTDNKLISWKHNVKLIPFIVAHLVWYLCVYTLSILNALCWNFVYGNEREQNWWLWHNVEKILENISIRPRGKWIQTPMHYTHVHPFSLIITNSQDHALTILHKGTIVFETH